MNYRVFGRTGWRVSEIGLGTWQVGGGWRSRFDEAEAERILDAAIEAGVNFIDTADVYCDGLSERVVGKRVRAYRSGHGAGMYIATKCGRGIVPHTIEEYTPARLTEHVERSLVNSGLDCLDLIQLHCPPPEVYERDDIFGCFDTLRERGKIGHLGVSVESIEQAHRAIRYPNVASIQIIYNMFRQRPKEQFFAAAVERGVAVIVRVPLASGMLSGKFGVDSAFAADDHRNFNREGAAFDKGETFSGVPYKAGLAAVEEIRGVVPAGATMAQCALRWILDASAVSCIIPGASRPEQARDNCAAADLAPLSVQQHELVARVYDRHIRAHVHHMW